MRYRVVDGTEFSIVGLKARVPLVHAGPNQAIIDFVRGIDPRVTERLTGLSDVSDQEPQGLVAVCDDLDPSRAEGTELDYHQAVITSGATLDGCSVLPVRAGTWAVFTASGPAPQAIQELWRDVFTQWFPSNPYRSRPGPEILRVRPSPDHTEAEAELWLPVEREQG